MRSPWAASCSHQLPVLVIGHDGPRAAGTGSWDFWDPRHGRNTQAVHETPVLMNSLISQQEEGNIPGTQRWGGTLCQGMQ